MSRSYPIWNKVQACIYQSDKSYGAKNQSEVNVLVGTSSKNSHNFLSHKTIKIETDEKLMFKFYVDGIKIKELVIKKEKGKLTNEVENNYFNLNVEK